MKSTRKTLIPTLLGLLSFIFFGCQSGNSSETGTGNSPKDELINGQEADQNKLQPMPANQITNITWRWAELIGNNPTAHSIVPDPENYTLTFWNDGTFSLKADCNLGSGSYAVEGSKIEFNPILSSMAMCRPESLHDQYLDLLGQAKGFGQIDGKLGLTLQDKAAEMRFDHGGPAEKPLPEEKTLYVGPQKAACVGVAPMECLQVKENPEDPWQLFYHQIEGFEWQSGYTYELRIAVHAVENPPADASSLRYELLEVVNRVESPLETEKQPPYIQIEHPTLKAELDTSKSIIVNGRGVGMFEGNVVVQALDATGNALALASTLINSPDAGIGGEGSWQVELHFSVDDRSSGKIIAFSPSPKDGQGWLARDEIMVTFLPEIASSSLENTNWQLIRLMDGALNSALAVHQITALFNPIEARISGNAGCNRYFASYELDGDRIFIPGPIGTTKMLCPEPQMMIESSYLQALEQTNHFELRPDNTLNLFDAQGNSILLFQVDPYSTTASFTRKELENTTYLNEIANAGIVQLVNGMYREPMVEGSDSELIVGLTNFAAFGDLDNNGQEEAVVVLVTNSGGSGTFYDLALIRKQGEALTNLAISRLGDRVQVQNLKLEDGEIAIEMLSQSPDDPICCPTQLATHYYGLQGGALVQISSEVME